MSSALPQSHHDYTFADYLALERDSEIKHEFDAGEILAMSGRAGSQTGPGADSPAPAGPVGPVGDTFAKRFAAALKQNLGGGGR